ncbi:MAG: hypothetical protein U1F87_06765 [Kiritimatiellia bacterium]
MNVQRILPLFSLLLFLGASERETALINTLKTAPDREAKEESCRALAQIGTRDAVPALAALLGSEELSHMARYALEPIPDPSVDEALRAALGQLKGRLLAGVLQSIGVRRDAAAVPQLAGCLADPDAEVARAAAQALGNIATTAAVLALQTALPTAPAAVQPQLCDALLHAAEVIQTGGDGAAAAKIYDALQAGSTSPTVQAAALRGSVLARGRDGLPRLIAALNGGDEHLFAAALRTAIELPGTEVTQALATECSKMPEARQLLLLQTLGLRRDPAAAPSLEALARAGKPELRLAALGSLSQIGSAASVPVFAALIGDADPAVADAAQNALAGLPGPAVDTAIVALLDQQDAKIRKVAVDMTGLRRIPGAVPVLLKTAADADPAVSGASLGAERSGRAGRDPGVDRSPGPAANPAAVEKTLATICTRPTGPVGGQVVIVSAAYGKLPDGPKADVTAAVSGLVKKGALAIPADNGAFGDTAPGIVKQLHVDYTVNGQPGSQTVGEGEVLTLTAPGANPRFAKSFCAALPGAPPAARCGLLRLLRYAGGPEAIAAVQAATADADPVIKDAALRVLCDWPTADAVPALARFLKGAPEAKFKILALRGYLRLVPLLTVPPGEKLAAVVEALDRRTATRRSWPWRPRGAAIPTPEALAVRTRSSAPARWARRPPDGGPIATVLNPRAPRPPCGRSRKRPPAKRSANPPTPFEPALRNLGDPP